MAYTGKFTPTQPDKYNGNPANIIYRSLWERSVMIYLDTNPKVLKWSSEEIQISYYNPLDRKYHRYYPDFWLRIEKADGKQEELVIEIKPERFTREPVKPKKQGKKYLQECALWIKNKAKWDSAIEFCKQRNWKFKLLTEKTLRPGNRFKQ